MQKAASGSLKHVEEAAAAVTQAAKCLDGHHGSASGLMAPWPPQGKGGKGKGKAAPATSLTQEVQQLKELMLQSYADPWTRKGIGLSALV